MKRVAFLGAGFAYMVLLIEAIRAAVAWWRGELAQPGWGDVALIAVGLGIPAQQVGGITHRRSPGHAGLRRGRPMVVNPRPRGHPRDGGRGSRSLQSCIFREGDP